MNWRTVIAWAANISCFSGWFAYFWLRRRTRAEAETAAAERAIHRLGGWELDGIKLPDPTDLRWTTASVQGTRKGVVTKLSLLRIENVYVDVDQLVCIVGVNVSQLPNSKEYSEAVLREYRRRLVEKALK
jgi:hypothetical protein